MSVISDNHIDEVCKIGRGHDCCRYLTMGPGGFHCAKFGEHSTLLDKRAADKTMVARGNNCDGWTSEENKGKK